MNRMYVMRHKKIVIMVISVLLLVVFFQWDKLADQKQMKDRLAEKIEELGTQEFRIYLWNPDVSAQSGQEIDINWWHDDENDTYYFFLPSVICDNLCYVFNRYESICIDETEIFPGEKFALEAGHHSLLLDSGESFSLEVMNSDNINSMFIETDSGDLTAIHESKDNFDSGSYILLDALGDVNCSGILTTIKGRGNMTFDAADKKSYNIRMQDKTAVLDLGIAKGWSLLANAFDESLIRNQLVAEMGKAMNMAYTPDMDYVDLYINGTYMGNYQLAERVEISEERLNIRNLEQEMEVLNPDVEFDFMQPIEEPVDDFVALKWVEGLQVPENYTSGYLLELEMTYRYYQEQCGFISARNQPVVIKSPQCVSFEQAYYVAEKYQELEDTLCSSFGYNEETGLYYYDYLDLHSFAQKYLIDEFSKNMDAAITSFFMYLPQGEERFFAGPIWDYDRTFGVDFERSGIDLKDPYTFYVSENTYYEQADVNFWYLLCLQEEFQELYKKMYFEEVRDVAVDLVGTVDGTVEKIEGSAMMDAIRCRSLSHGTDVESNRKEFYEYGEYIKSFMENRIQFLDEEWSEE